MTAKTMPCAVPGCGRAIRTNSATGVCRNHMHYVGVCACRQCADPEFAAKHAAAASERMRKLNADPEFAAKHAAAASERMRKLNADPAHNPLAALTPQQRADYYLLRKKGGYTRDEALAAIRR